MPVNQRLQPTAIGRCGIMRGMRPPRLMRGRWAYNRNMSWQWFGVKTVYRLEASGEPEGIDRGFARDVSLVEERVVLVRARSLREAIRKAGREARAYVSQPSHRNPYGQRVRWRLLKYCDAYRLFEDPRSGAEVFSATEVVASAESDQRVLDRFIGFNESPRDLRRRNFQNLVFNKLVPGVTPTQGERELLDRIYDRPRRRSQKGR